MAKLGLGTFSDIAELLRKKVNKRILADFGQFGLDIIGIFDPTGAADAANAVISIIRGDWFGAITSFRRVR